MVDTTIVLPADTGEGASRSAVSWAAIIAGGLTAAAVSFILLILGTGLGLSSGSPWANLGATATTLGVGAVIWLIVTQWIAAGLGGYLTGRLRTRWVSVLTHEVFFRDTAHGFLSWALATVISAALLASALSTIISGAATQATTLLSGAVQGAAQGAAQSAGQSGLTTPSVPYFTDMLFRANPPAAGAPAAGTPAAGTPATPGNGLADTRAESQRILVASLAAGDISPADRTYLAQRIAAQTGLSQADAEKRVDDVMTQAKAAIAKVKQAADQARKAAATLALFLFVSLLIGAFIASVAAAFGGHERDEIEVLYARR